jgi:hypothetical protein
MNEKEPRSRAWSLCPATIGHRDGDGTPAAEVSVGR